MILVLGAMIVHYDDRDLIGPFLLTKYAESLPSIGRVDLAKPSVSQLAEHGWLANFIL